MLAFFIQARGLRYLPFFSTQTLLHDLGLTSAGVTSSSSQWVDIIEQQSITIGLWFAHNLLLHRFCAYPVTKKKKGGEVDSNPHKGTHTAAVNLMRTGPNLQQSLAMITHWCQVKRMLVWLCINH